MSTLYLVSCVSQKAEGPAKAKDLYTSPWFIAARAYAEKMSHDWFVLSAKHGLLHPDTQIEPYDCTLKDMTASERRQWASKVLDQLRLLLPRVEEVVLLAGKRYREFLVEPLEREGEAVWAPMEHISGNQVQVNWLNKQLGN